MAWRMGVALLVGFGVLWLFGESGARRAAGYPTVGYPAPVSSPAVATVVPGLVRRVSLPLAARDAAPRTSGYPAPYPGPALSPTPPRPTATTHPDRLATPSVATPIGTRTPAASRTPETVRTPSGTPGTTRTSTPSPAEAAANLAVVSRSDRSDGSAHHVYLTVQNRGTATVYRPRAVVTFRSPSGDPLGTAGEGFVRQMLAPGDSSTTRVTVHPAAGWASYDVQLLAEGRSDVRYVHAGLTVHRLSSAQDGADVHVEGELRNDTGGTVRAAVVDVGLYAPDGRIVEHTAVYVGDFGPIASGVSLPFRARFWDGEGNVPPGYRYEVLAEAAVPSGR